MSSSNKPSTPRPSNPSRRGDYGDHLRFEGLVFQKRVAKVEKTRYLAIDLKSNSISLYKRPPPKKSGPVTASIVNRTVSTSGSQDNVDGSSGNVSLGGEEEKSQAVLANLAHISRENYYSQDGTWEPKWTIPSSVDWKIRDVENDETMFYLVLPADYRTKDKQAEMMSMRRVGKTVSYYGSANGNDRLSNSLPSLGRKISSKKGSTTSLNEAKGISGNDFNATTDWDGNFVDADDYNTEATSNSSNLPLRLRLLSRAFKTVAPERNEIIYQFRVLLDGNEKFLWLQAAAEIGRLATESAINICAIGNTVNVTKGLLVLPSQRGRATSVALRYAEWAMLADKLKSVSSLELNSKEEKKMQRGNENEHYDSTKLVKVVPTYAYRNRRMTEKDLYNEMLQPSEKWEDFRDIKCRDRDDPMIGCLYCEILACHGLPKLDRFSPTDACCYFVCGPFAFASDVIDGFNSPVWPSKSRRACIFPIFYAYMKLYVGIFDNDGAGVNDDFAGRVVIDISKLRPKSSYDIFLPLRLYQNAYVTHPRGVIHLRLKLEWNNERKALLSYLKLPTKTEKLGNAITLNCADTKAFRNVVLTIQGKDVPGRYKQIVMKGLQREMKLYKVVMKNAVKEQMQDIVFWVSPFTSLCFFVAWMHCVYSNSVVYVPAYFVAGVNAILLKNYLYFGKDDYNAGFTPITISEMLLGLILGGDHSSYIKSVQVSRKIQKSKLASGEERCLLGESSEVLKGGGIRMDDDHLEFPFSEKGKYPKKTLSEACVDASALFQEDDMEERDSKSLGPFGSLRRRNKKVMNFIKPNLDDDDEEAEEEFGVMSPTVQGLAHIPTSDAVLGKIQEFKQNIGVSDPGESTVASMTSQEIKSSETQSSVWKRTKEFLPEQDASIRVKKKMTLKQEILHNKDLMHRMSMRLFDDRLFIINDDDPNYSIGGEVVLDNAIGTHKHNNPMVAKMGEYMAPLLEIMKVGLSVWRAGFNLFTWRDPFLSFLFLFGNTFLLVVLIIFPWRHFFFAVGLGAFGPQNWFIRILHEREPKTSGPSGPTDTAKKLQQKKPLFGRKFGEPVFNLSTVPGIASLTPGNSKTVESSDEFRFHSHLATMGGHDFREKIDRQSRTIHRAVVPNSPFVSRRFYDWPPNPSLSKIDVDGCED
mmetsp:Transcript_19924/g.41899  ORF Transcript_19924/g.41899 Transcript_19924/m.41899 type:complete len:1150 (+) Transcript_19924:42-3491(+)